MLPLQGVKVLDLSRLLPGPYASLVLADLGAHVDKLEDPAGGDYARHTEPFVGEVSALFAGLNRNKRSIALDLKSPAGVSTFRRLVPHYDVVIESFRPGVMERLGIDYPSLAALNPRLVYCAISGYGQVGPARTRAGHDLNFVARAGALGFSGPAAGAPTIAGVQIADMGGALFGVIGILAALQERAQSGKGRLVDISLAGGALSFLHMHLAARLAMGSAGTPLRRGEDLLGGERPCYGVYRTRDDRYMAVAAIEPKFFEGLCTSLGVPELVTGAYAQGAEGHKVRSRLEAIFVTRTQVEWIQHFQGLDVCVEPVLEGDEVLHDPQLVATGAFATHGALRTPVSRPEVAATSAPGLGQHTAEILRECGIDPSAAPA